MRTTFRDWEDKQLVQIALVFENEGVRVAWEYVARCMAKSKRIASQLRMRLAALKRTYGKVIKGFPPCFIGGSAPGQRLLSSRGHISRARNAPSQGRLVATYPTTPVTPPPE
jgi:hypothetical protein